MTARTWMPTLALAAVLAVGCKQPTAGPLQAEPPEEKPAAVEEKPAAVEEKPAAVEEKPAAVEEKPAAEEAPEAAAGEEAAEDDEEAAGEEAAEDDEAAEDEGKGGKGPAKIVLTPASGKAKPVTFKHKMHQGLMGCKKCHHDMESPKGTATACTDCHGVDDSAPDAKTVFHKKCKGCHNTMGAGPTACKECH